GRGTWRLNESLLSDSTFLQQVKTDLEEYFQANSGGDVPDQTVWLAHKAVARGLFIRRSSYLKKSRQKTQLECQKLLAVATTQNKLNPSPALAKQRKSHKISSQPPKGETGNVQDSPPAHRSG
ncbi:Hypothetical predicted protein, partial [Pelobates cultripes]